MTDKFVTVAGKPTIPKDPQATLDYYIDFNPWLPAGDPISTHSATGTGIVVDSHQVSAGIMQMWLSGGTLGSTASVVARVTTVGGRTDERTVYFKIKNR